MNKHTPGPWVATVPPSSLLTTRHIETEHGELIAEVGTPGGGGVGTIQDVANARLIAAAPELLTALENVIQFHYGNKGLRGECDHIGWVRVARAAIAKATGGEP